MKTLKQFNKWSPINEEAALRTLNTKEDYWIKKGKIGKKVALYTHDDMDGIFCAIEMKKWLLKHKFEIVKYGVVSYTEGWKYTNLDPTLINIALDFAKMPGDERDQHIDWYLDHHGLFSESDLERYKDSPVKKMATSSAYEALCLALGISTDGLVLSPIDMIDAAKYGATEEDETEPQIIRGEEQENKRQKIKVGNPKKYKVDWQRLLNFNLSEIIDSKNRRLEFAAAFNQLLKRSDTKTLISVIENCDEASIYKIFNVMKKIYPEHNVIMGGARKGQKKDFIEDSEWRLGEMQRRTRGSMTSKITYKTQSDFEEAFKNGKYLQINGYQKIGNLVFVPTGTWANALRARVIVEKDFRDGILDSEPDFILLQYGGTLQVCSYKDINKIKDLPLLTSENNYTMHNFVNDFQTADFFKPFLQVLVDNEDKTDLNMESLVLNFMNNPEDWSKITKMNKIQLSQLGLDMYTATQIYNALQSKIKNPVNDLGRYMTELLQNFQKYLGYHNPDTSLGQDEITVSGGHGGIGSISNVYGFAEAKTGNEEDRVVKLTLKYNGLKYIDMIKNKIISDLSGVPFNLNLKWSEPAEAFNPKEPAMDNKVIAMKDVTKLDRQGNLIKSFENFKSR